MGILLHATKSAELIQLEIRMKKKPVKNRWDSRSCNQLQSAEPCNLTQRDFSSSQKSAVWIHKLYRNELVKSHRLDPEKWEERKKPEEGRRKGKGNRGSLVKGFLRPERPKMQGKQEVGSCHVCNQHFGTIPQDRGHREKCRQTDTNYMHRGWLVSMETCRQMEEMDGNKNKGPSNYFRANKPVTFGCFWLRQQQAGCVSKCIITQPAFLRGASVCANDLNWDSWGLTPSYSRILNP